ncbi:UQCRH isoform 2 [Pan troglodytes]|uniref:Ubiquinol-cytochrome c reductase hinge protein n=3 Tax=Hominidae TaxID=9604 RepID=A0A087X2B9_HUMAN|nr:ubiquinol-cytochrome c reductase hinge protein [Homo sapiens]KAI4080494.1 ubiquinol-cytochrome c reductase hinge protein [Homo sapiens]PNI52940.1 UQCRH isoform 2 [Pan troglodytes]PNJ21646.1 UQCRH isoform 2 [Pongo abelii]
MGLEDEQKMLTESGDPEEEEEEEEELVVRTVSGSPNNSERAMRAVGEMCKGPGAARAL